MQTKIFEGDSVKNLIKQMLKEGYLPASLEETSKARKEGKIPTQWYDTGTLRYKGKLRKATKKALQNIEKIYEEKGRLLFLGDGLVGDFLSDDGRFLGVKRQSRNKRGEK